MSEVTYDPEFPFVLQLGGVNYARFRNSADANESKALPGLRSAEMIDTTPKPKIPEDAEFVYVELKDGPYYVRKRADGSWVDQTSSRFTSTDHLTRFLKGEGDAEVTVLVRKEDA